MKLLDARGQELWTRDIRLKRLKHIFYHVGTQLVEVVEQDDGVSYPDKTNPKGVHIGAETYVAFDAAILTHDLTRGLKLDTRIGKRCFIGARSIILPGIEIGDECVIGAGSVVTRSLPPRTLAAGNPARVIRNDIEIISRYGRLAPVRKEAAE